MSILARRFNPHETETTPPQLQVLPAPGSAGVPPAPAGMKKVNLSGVAKKKESGKTEYPVLPHNEEAAAMALQIVRDTDQFEALKGTLDQNKKFLIAMAAPFHFEFAYQKTIDKSLGIIVEAAPDENQQVRRLRVDFKESYPTLESERAIIPIIGQDAVNQWFHQSFEFKIDGDKLPADTVGEIVSELQALFQKYNASDALTVKEGIVPNAGFHLKRHVLFTPIVNLRLHDVCPIRAAVATKNVK